MPDIERALDHRFRFVLRFVILDWSSRRKPLCHNLGWARHCFGALKELFFVCVCVYWMQRGEKNNMIEQYCNEQAKVFKK